MMSSPDEVEAVFDAALDVPAADRDAFVRERCGGDQALYDEVMALLAADAREGTLVVDVPMGELLDPADERAPSFGRGDRVQGYEILRPIGEGGFAHVYLAQQTEPVRRRVALKTLKPGASKPQVVARFRAERQALALMDHPSIAKVFDSGVTEAGLPFFVMEYVEGEPITEHCDAHQLSLAERLELLVLCCEAVQHAHRRAVIHRDLKPSNILVTLSEGRSIPKLIDFGVAKAVEQKLTPDSIHTVEGALIGTPAYMSPEQVSETDQAIDTRADVYALGVVMHELLTGKLPFESSPGAAGLVELMRAIREDDALRPSSVIDIESSISVEVASRRRTKPKTLARALKGDLDWIVLTALAKDRDHRYGSPMSLAEDVRRYLTDQPVLARPPSLHYRARKLVRRNPTAVVAAALSVIFVVAFALTMAMQAARERRAGEELARVVAFQAQQMREVEVQWMGIGMRRRVLEQARAALDRADLEPPDQEKQLAELERLLSGVNFTTLAADTLADNIFTANLEAVSEQFADQPLVKARLLQSLASQMRDVGLLEPSVAPQKEALEIRRKLLGEAHPATLRSTAEMGHLLEVRGQLAAAAPYVRAALDGRRRILGPQHPETLASLHAYGATLLALGRRDEAEPMLRAAVDGKRAVLGPEHPSTLESIEQMLVLLQHANRLPEAEQLLTEALHVSSSALGDEHSATLSLLDRRASLSWRQGKLAEAEAQCRKALALHRKVLGDEHPRTLELLFGLATVLAERGALQEAEASLREVLKIQVRVQGARHFRTLTTRNNLARLLQQRGRHDEAARELRALARLAPKAVGPDHPESLNVLLNLGISARALGQLDEAESALREAFDRSARAQGEDDVFTLVVATKLGDVLNQASRFEEAERLLRGTFPARARAHGEEHWRTANARSVLGHTLAGLRRFVEGERELLEAYAALETAVPSGRRQEILPLAAERLAFLYDAWNRPKEAARWRAKSSPEQAR